LAEGQQVGNKESQNVAFVEIHFPPQDLKTTTSQTSNTSKTSNTGKTSKSNKDLEDDTTNLTINGQTFKFDLQSPEKTFEDIPQFPSEVLI
jgi:hypothetical protein